MLTTKDWARIRENNRRLLERIAYHDAKLREEHPGWTPPRTGDEWAAYHQKRWAERNARSA